MNSFYRLKLYVRLRKYAIYTSRLFYIALKKFYKDECFGKASILSYISILSLVPVAILVFSVFSTFDSSKEVLNNIINEKIIPHFFPSEGETISGYLSDFSESVYKLTILGVIFFIVAAVDIVLILENTANSIWQVNKGRSLLSNFMIYWSMITIGPLILTASFYITSEYGSYIMFGQEFSQFLFPWLITWFGFFFIYQYIPNTKIKPLSAIIAAAIAGFFWEFGKYGFTFYISEVANQTWGKIYGKLYIIPIFIIWIYLSFAILLYGMEISYLIQFSEIYKKKQFKNTDLDSFKLFFILNSLYLIFDNYDKGKGGLEIKNLANQNRLSRYQTSKLIAPLIDKGIVIQIYSDKKKTILSW